MPKNERTRTKSEGGKKEKETKVNVGSSHSRVMRNGVTHGNGTSEREGAAMNLEAVDGSLDAEKVALLAGKQQELDSVFDRHDTLVREIFHMEHFVTMVAFNPVEAKQENSPVFREYKAKYDILDTTANVVGPSRRTRSAHSERQKILTHPSTSPLFPTSPVKSPEKRKPKVANTAAIWDILASAHKKGKGKEKERDGPKEIEVLENGSEFKEPQPIQESISTPRARRLSKADAENAQGGNSISSAIPVRASTRRQTLTTTAPPVLTRRKAVEETPSSPDPPKHNIKRIRLIVRQPPPTISHHRQRLPKPKFDASISAFLASYRTLDGQDITESALRDLAKKDALVMERTLQFREQGRFIPGTDVLFGSSVTPQTPYTAPQRTTRDIWDDIVEIIIIQGKVRANKKSLGKQIGAQIAGKIQAYWDGHAAKKDKARAAEERRLRALAKNTIKLVTQEWKKAVFHIREQERLRLEAEEVKRGHEHLDAILDQSGQMLETQQGDLSRGEFAKSRSRSSSVTDIYPRWGSDDGVEDSDDEEEVDEEGGGERAGDDVDDSGETDDEDDNLETERNSGDEMDADDEDPGESLSALLGPVLSSDLSPSDGQVEQPYPSESATSSRSSPSAGFENSEDQEGSEASVHDLLNRDIEPPSSPLHASPSPHAHDADTTLIGGSSPPFVAEHDEEMLALSSPALEYPTPGDAPTTDVFGATEETNDDGGQGVDEERDDMTAQAANDVDDEPDVAVPQYLKPFAVAPVEWDPEAKVKPPLLLRGNLRPYQQTGLEWLASLHMNNMNGILADEMGLGKTIQTISLLAHLACDRGIWGPHLIVVPTSVLLNWEMEFKKFLPGFKILSYHGTTKRRKELRQGWNDRHHFNVCITSYTLASRDAHIFKRKAWYYMILDEAHMIKNFKSQRWNILLMFRSFRRLLLTGTPLQNNLTELWALLQFLMSGSNFANVKEFGEWFSNPLEKAIEMGNVLDDETMQRVSKLHTVLRPYLLRRLKRDVEKELPSKYEHLVLCPLSKRQRFLYDEFMARAHTRDALQSGVYQKIANILMQLRKVCNHPDLFEVRPIVTSFAMPRSAIADFEIKELLIRRRLLQDDDERLNLDTLGLRFIDHQGTSMLAAVETRRLDATSVLPFTSELPGEPPPKDLQTAVGFRRWSAYQQRISTMSRWTHIGYLNKLRCSHLPIYWCETLAIVKQFHQPLLPLTAIDQRSDSPQKPKWVGAAIKSYSERAREMGGYLDRFAFVTPAVVALDLPRIALAGVDEPILDREPDFDAVLHRASVKLQIAFPDPSLLQYDCGKLQELTNLLREKKAGGHRVLIFTQMTRILDILEIFLNFHGYLYLRLDGATKIEDRQYITERFNADSRVFCFIASSRSGGVGINLTGADTVVFYDSDFNPQMDRQCEDRAHRIGQIRDVHIYRFVSQHTVEEAMLRKANQKRSLDDLVIQQGEFDWRSLFDNENALTKALGEYEDTEDALAAAVAAREENVLEGADEADFGGDVDADQGVADPTREVEMSAATVAAESALANDDDVPGEEDQEEEEEGGTAVDYMLAFVQLDYEYFKEWRL